MDTPTLPRVGMRTLLERTAFYVTDLEDQGASTYILFLPELGVLPSKAIAVDTYKIDDAAVVFYRGSARVASLHHKTEWMLLARSIVQTMTREQLYRMERSGEKDFTALMKELYPEESAVVEARIAGVKRQGTGGSVEPAAVEIGSAVKTGLYL